MSKSIWHTQKETPEEDRLIVVENRSGVISVGSEFEYDLDRVEKWAYFDDFLALETELERTRKELDVAVDEITKIKVAAESVGIGFFMTAAIVALAKINTTLEQKEHFADASKTIEQKDVK